MILFEEIYGKAFVLFDDPKITQAYETNKIAFCKYMYSFFNNISIYEPVIVGQILSDITPPKGEMEVFTANNDSSEFALQMKIPDNSQVIAMANGELQQATYDSNTQKIKFNKTITKDSECSVEYYFAGAFNGDFSAISGDSSVSRNIEQKVKNILARLLVIAWSESVRDMLVDIQGILRDTDFKLTPNSQILNAKVNWVRSLQEKNQAEQTQLAWIVRFSKNKGKFSR